MTAPATNPKLIKAIQTCRRKVAGLDDDATWRDLLEQVAGRRSLRAMTGPQLGKVLDELHRRGAPKATNEATGRPRYGDTPQLRMIRALWRDAADCGAIADPSEAAMASFVRRQTRQDFGRLGPAEAAGVIEALKRMIARAQSKAQHP
jgi:phage gp16-like protein